MKNGNPKEFIEMLYNGEDTYFIFNGITYFAQGYSLNDMWHYEIVQENPISEFVLWEFDGESSDIVKAFESAKIFNGKTFWEVEKDIEWIDP